MSTHKNVLSPEQQEVLLKNLKARFEKNISRHKDVDWNKVQEKLEANPAKLWSLNEMERTEGEPDVVGYDAKTDEYIFTIARQKALKAVEVFAMTGKPGKPENNTNQRIQL